MEGDGVGAPVSLGRVDDGNVFSEYSVDRLRLERSISIMLLVGVVTSFIQGSKVDLVASNTKEESIAFFTMSCIG
eukprot:7710099-Ditylum_brightwellii.AAC.1